jgi:hypothetical protein
VVRACSGGGSGINIFLNIYFSFEERFPAFILKNKVIKSSYKLHDHFLKLCTYLHSKMRLLKNFFKISSSLQKLFLNLSQLIAQDCFSGF